ncbi:CmcJ/NvfI family oxidoreductase [Algihabitans albus]|uniref:CmcJ/NvfI family oxidoreductase n=1 Tax=Algihabitans albus TaxID=2164067 RepID=UPI001ABC92D3|nr:CmcJ/NvfI family oxidoreductase [Algihabitans albus]
MINQPLSSTQLETASIEASGAVVGSLNFIRRQDSKPVIHSAALTGDVPRFFFGTEERSVSLADMRPLARTLSLDRQGFTLQRRPTAVTDFYDDAAIAEVYIPEIEALLRNELGAGRVIVFDSTRRSDSQLGAANPDGRRGPATRVHVDYTITSGPQRLRDLLGEAEAQRLLGSDVRVAQVNVWRPIRGPVRRSPLALADAATIRAEDLIATDQVFPERTGEIYHLAYHPAQRWYYAPEMTPDELLLIKGWDSLDDGRARFTPHSAVVLQDVPKDAPPRESIEVRTLVVFD